VRRPSDAIYRHLNEGPTFGRGYDIRIDNIAKSSSAHSYTNFGFSYSVPSKVQDRKTILAGTYEFSPDEVEVFYLG